MVSLIWYLMYVCEKEVCLLFAGSRERVCERFRERVVSTKEENPPDPRERDIYIPYIFVFLS